MQFIVFYHNIKVPWLHSKHSGQEPRRAGGPLTSPSGLVAKEGVYGKKKMSESQTKAGNQRKFENLKNLKFFKFF